jgi:hypothetical protein
LYTKFYIKLNNKFQHIKKQKLNQELYQMQLNLIQDWNKSWFLIQQITNQFLDNKRQKKYKTIDSYLSPTQTETSKQWTDSALMLLVHLTFCYLMKNLILLNKGMKYNLHVRRLD